MIAKIARVVTVFVLYTILAASMAFFGVVWLIDTYGDDLPGRERVVDHEPATITRLHAGDGQLIAEYSSKRRLFVPIEAIPTQVQQAFISAEDKSFLTHKGVDWLSLAESIPNNVNRALNGRRLVGSSTITMQVAKNFVVGDRRALERKIREIFSALEIEKEVSKAAILELYLNEIYFGARSYGIAAAALTIFNKSVENLELHEAAYLAAVIKGPENYHPYEDTERAITRRNWVIDRMVENGYAAADTAERAKEMAIGAQLGAYRNTIADEAPYFAEEVRKQLVRDYGISEVNEGGLSVRTTVDLDMQTAADRALKDGLIAYDKRHGYRGPLAQIDPNIGIWTEALAAVEQPFGTEKWAVALVLEVGNTSVRVGLINGGQARIRLEDTGWAGQPLPGQEVAAAPTNMQQVLNFGDVILVEITTEPAGDLPLVKLQQKPEVNGGLVALSPHTGRVLALSGGWSFKDSEFNRVTQAKRQPGSTVKPFVFLAALDQGFSPTSQILDSPVSIEQVDGSVWRPGNYDGKFLGQQPMRVGLEKSRNLMTVRLASAVGMDTVASYARRFGIGDGFKPYLSAALGATESTLIDMATAYAQLANGGRKIEPTLIDRIQNRRGDTLFRHDQRPCSSCQAQGWNAQPMPVLLDDRVLMADPVSIFQIQSMLRGVVQRGTARRAVGQTVDRPVAGKTGTSNNFQDAWFVGFTPDLVVAVYIGFDNPRTLGKGEGGGKASAPIFADFINQVLADEPPQDFRKPKGIVLANVDPQTGLLSDDGIQEAIREDELVEDEFGGVKRTEETFTDESGYITSSRDGSTVGAIVF